MSVATDHLTVFRTQWATRFIDDVTITDLTDRGTFNRATGAYDTPSSSTVLAADTNGNSLMRPASVRSKDRGMEGETLHDYDIYIAHDTTGVKVGNSVAVTTCTFDADLTGTTLTVQAVESDSYNTRKRLKCVLSLGGDDLG